MSHEKTMSLGALVLSTVLCAGCFEQKIALSLHGNRSGKLHVWRESGRTLSRLELLGWTEVDGGRRSRNALTGELACWSGVSAWTNEKCSIDDDRVVIEADAWFDDVNDLARDEAGVGRQTFACRPIAGRRMQLEWTFTPEEAWNRGTLEQCKQRTDLLAGLSIKGEIALPGPISEAKGVSKFANRQAAWTLASAADMKRDIASLEGRAGKGELTPDEAERLLHRSHAKRSAAFRYRSVESASDARAFRRELEAAKRTYEAGSLKKEVEELRKSHEEAVPTEPTGVWQ